MTRRARLVWSGSLGGTETAYERIDAAHGRLTIGEREVEIGPETEVWHLSGVRPRLIVETPGRPPFVFRYRLGVLVTLARFLEAPYDLWSAEADDPGLELAGCMGAHTDWRRPSDPLPPKPRSYHSARRWERRFGRDAHERRPAR